MLCTKFVPQTQLGKTLKLSNVFHVLADCMFVRKHKKRDYYSSVELWSEKIIEH